MILVLSADNDGYFGNDDNGAGHRAMSLTPSRPHPPPPPARPVDAPMSSPVPRQVATGKDDGVANVYFSPAIASPSAFSPAHRDEAKKNDGSSLSDDGFASRQGAACRAVGRAIRESGARLKLKGTWWSSRSSHNGNSALLGDDNHVDGATTQESHSIGEEGYGTVAQLESMVRDYCGIVEGTIGRQQTKIDELLAFCDHLEKEVAGKRC